MRRVIRKLRHYKQRFQPNAGFIWRRRTVFGGKTYEPGDLIPEALAANKSKLELLWDADQIELAEFELPDVATGQGEAPADTEPPGPDEPIDESPADEPVDESPPEPEPAPVTWEKAKGTWWLVQTPDGERRVNGKKNLNAVLAEYGLPPVE